eukprot:scaffold4437_cov391-Prasinococcus_capsulatus_cf.AAC.14
MQASISKQAAEMVPRMRPDICTNKPRQSLIDARTSETMKTVLLHAAGASLAAPKTSQFQVVIECQQSAAQRAYNVCVQGSRDRVFG